MSRARTVCLIHGCPEMAVARGRCRSCAAEHERHQRRTVPTKIAGARHAERQRRAAAVDLHRRRHGDWCAGYKRSPHQSRDLTAEHSDALGDGGALSQSLSVLCRSCNSRHGAETRNRWT